MLDADRDADAEVNVEGEPVGRATFEPQLPRTPERKPSRVIKPKLSRAKK
jgi:hypothetical protein